MSGARRLMLGGIGLTALLALVAVASRAHKPGGGSGAVAHPPRLFIEYVASLMVLMIPIAVVVIMFALAHSRHESALRGQRNWRRTMLMVLIVSPLIAFLAVRHFHVANRPLIRPPTVPHTPPGKLKPGPKKPAKDALQPKFQWLPPLLLGSVMLGAAVTIAGAIYLRRRRGDAWAEEAAMLEAIDEVLSDSLDDLRAERDPRRAVIRTYARMERTFAAYGVPRLESEVPQEYVDRVLDRLGVSVYSVRKLADLFSRAKFSPHAIDAAMKDEAIDALVGLRAELAHGDEEVAA
jgi:hypothetical protein